jgi:hypothetical protein
MSLQENFLGTPQLEGKQLQYEIYNINLKLHLVVANIYDIYNINKYCCSYGLVGLSTYHHQHEVEHEDP